MLISEHEIQKSLKLLSEQPLASGSRPEVDQGTNRLIQGQLEKLPDMRMDKVLPLRSAVRERRYNVPEEQVAEKLLGRCLADQLR